MSTPARTPVRARQGDPLSHAVPGWLYLLFFLSGISGLMYEVVWVRMLTRILGSTVYATSTLLILCAFGCRYRENFGQYVGTLYARNTLGAVVGVLASGFVLIGAVGETRTIVIGVILNGVVAAAALVLGRTPLTTAGSPTSD